MPNRGSKGGFASRRNQRQGEFARILSMLLAHCSSTEAPHSTHVHHDVPGAGEGHPNGQVITFHSSGACASDVAHEVSQSGGLGTARWLDAVRTL